MQNGETYDSKFYQRGKDYIEEYDLQDDYDKYVKYIEDNGEAEMLLERHILNNSYNEDRNPYREGGRRRSKRSKKTRRAHKRSRRTHKHSRRGTSRKH